MRSVLEAHRNEPFVWGSNDCATFAAACLDAVTGCDALGRLRGSYTTRLAARARMKARGWKGPREAASEILGGLGADEIPPRFSRVGDIGVTPDDVLCVRAPDGFVAPGLRGLAVAAHVETAWAVG